MTASFQIDHFYIAQVAELTSREDVAVDKEKLREECVNYIRKVVDHAIKVTLENAAEQQTRREQTRWCQNREQQATGPDFTVKTGAERKS